MSTEADDIEEQVKADALNGVGSFSNGSDSLSMASLEERMKVVDRTRRNDAVRTTSTFGIKVTKLIPGGTG